MHPLRQLGLTRLAGQLGGTVGRHTQGHLGEGRVFPQRNRLVRLQAQRTDNYGINSLPLQPLAEDRSGKRSRAHAARPRDGRQCRTMQTKIDGQAFAADADA